MSLEDTENWRSKCHIVSNISGDMGFWIFSPNQTHKLNRIDFNKYEWIDQAKANTVFSPSQIDDVLAKAPMPPEALALLDAEATAHQEQCLKPILEKHDQHLESLKNVATLLQTAIEKCERSSDDLYTETLAMLKEAESWLRLLAYRCCTETPKVGEPSMDEILKVSNDIFQLIKRHESTCQTNTTKPA